MSIDFCGPFAEARYRRASVFSMLSTGGATDWESARRTARWMWPDDEARQSAALGAAEHEASKLVRELWGPIACVAEILARDGILMGEDVPFSLRTPVAA